MSSKRSVEHFTQELEQLAKATGLDELTGLFPLDSEFRKLGIAYSTLFGAARALLLQVAYPTVGQGVHDFSDFDTDPIGRGVRTFLGVFAVGIGTHKTAIATGKMIFERHMPIKGTIPAYKPGMADRKYSALEPEANLWVWATLVEGIIFGHREVNDNVPRARYERMYEESKLFGRFFNVKPSLIPKTLADFEAYFDDVVQNKLEIIPAGQKVADALVHGRKFPYEQAGWLLRAFAAESLPANIRDGFGWRSTTQTRAIYGAVRSAARAYYAVSPEPLKTIPIASLPNLRRNFLGPLKGFISANHIEKMMGNAMREAVA